MKTTHESNAGLRFTKELRKCSMLKSKVFMKLYGDWVHQSWAISCIYAGTEIKPELTIQTSITTYIVQPLRRSKH
jgi:hypothetical protein